MARKMRAVVKTHEMAGTVIETGVGVTRTNVGARIAVETHIPCGTCIQCLTGDGHPEEAVRMQAYNLPCRKRAAVRVDEKGLAAYARMLSKNN